MKTRFVRVVGILAVLALVLAACGDGDTETTEAPGATDAPETTEAPDGGGGDMSTSDLGLPIIDPLDADTDATIGIAGSSTVFPLSTKIMEKWENEGGPNYPIDSIGSGGGFKRFCTEGASDISNASRPIKDSEIANCAGTGEDPIQGEPRTVIPIRVGTDALTLVVSKGNTFASELTFEQIATAFSLPPDSTWADVDPSFPAHPLEAFSPGESSGTFDFFFETIYPDIYDEDGTPPIFDVGSGTFDVGETDETTVSGVAEDGCTEGDTSTTCSIGYFGFAYFQQNADILTAVAVDAGEGDGPVEPGVDSVNDGSYPISRPLFMYTAEEIVAQKPHVAEFIAYYLNNVNEVIGEVGYFPAPDADLQEAADNIKAAAGWS